MSTSHLPSRRAVLGVIAFWACLTLIAAVPRSVARAHPPPGSFSSSDHDVVLEDASGRPLPSFWQAGKRFVLGELGQRYAVRITNRSPVRVEAVLTVDGRDAISGRPGDYARRGYLIAPFDSIVVKGFRKSLSEVASFRFTDPGDSYSARMGTPQNVGIIGVALFPEARAPSRRTRPFAERQRADRRYPQHGLKPRRANPNPRAGGAPRTAPKAESSAPGSASKRAAVPRSGSARREGSRRPYDRYEGPGDDAPRAPRDNLGTRYGERRTSRVAEVPFTRHDPRHPSAVITLRYDDADGLEARGIRVRPHPRPLPWWRPHHPIAFPESRFAPPPP